MRNIDVIWQNEWCLMFHLTFSKWENLVIRTKCIKMIINRHFVLLECPTNNYNHLWTHSKVCCISALYYVETMAFHKSTCSATLNDKLPWIQKCLYENFRSRIHRNECSFAFLFDCRSMESNIKNNISKQMSRTLNKKFSPQKTCSQNLYVTHNKMHAWFCAIF